MWRPSLGYQIQEKLGEGSQGSVFKALRRDPKTGLSETVAIKILHSETAVELWRSEFESLRRIHSKYCVQVFSFERIRGRPALVLEFVDGISVGHLAQSGVLAEDFTNEIAAQLEEAVCDLRAQNLFHGDLSPHNILIDRDGKLRLLDFGLANLSGRFTPDFAAPERHAGENASFFSDLFSIGRIEQFLRAQNFSTYSESPLLIFSPEQRRLTGRRSLPEARKKLGAHVALILARRNSLRKIITQVLTQGKPRWRPNCLTAALVGATLCLVASSAIAKLPNEFHMQIRTNHWHYFILDGQPIGYSPVAMTLQAGRAHRLEWISARGRGVKLLSAAPRTSHILQDRDF